MQAAVAEQLGQPLVLKDLPRPDIGSDDVLLRVEASGICYTDLRVIDAMGTLPLIPGHEPVGTVEAVGSSVTDVGPGDRIGVHSLFSCGECDWCRLGEDEACVLGTTRLAGVAFDGGYAEYMRLPASRAIPLPDGLSFIDAAPMFCAGLTTYAALKNGNIQPGQRVAITGIGGLGHLAIPIAKAMGAAVYAVTTSPDKVELARRLGADQAGDVETIARELEEAGGAHALLNTANSLEPVGRLAPVITKQGTIVLTAADGDALPFPPALFLGKQLRVIGSFFGSRQDLRELLALAQEHGIRPITEVYPLAEVNAVHERLRNNEVRYRAVLVPRGE